MRRTELLQEVRIKGIDIPGWRRRAPGEILWRDDDVETAVRADQMPALLQLLSRIQRSALADPRGPPAPARG